MSLLTSKSAPTRGNDEIPITFVLPPLLVQIFLKCQYGFQIETQIVSVGVRQRIELHSRKMNEVMEHIILFHRKGREIPTRNISLIQ